MPVHVVGAGRPLEPLLRDAWRARLAAGLVDYDPRLCASRIVPGAWGFVAQHNEKRHALKRPTELVSVAVLQPFAAGNFNFGRVGAEEALCDLSAAGGPLAGAGPHRVFVNKSPIGDGHVLLVPQLAARRPQALDADALTMALALCAEVANPAFRVGYNSLGAYASVNHLHLHGYFLDAPLPIERAAVAISHARDGVVAGTLADYPTRALTVSGGDPAAIARAAAPSIAAMQAQNIPFNLLVAAQGQRLFIFPQAFGAHLAAGEVSPATLAWGIHPGAFELAGHLVLREAGQFAAVTEADACTLLGAASVDAPTLAALASTLLEPGRPSRPPRP